MVLSSINNLDGFSGSFGASTLKEVNFALSQTVTKLIKLCQACIDSMASIPPSAFSAAKIRETQKDMKVSNVTKNRKSDFDKVFSTASMELSPLHYNSKLMNSIWGFYNRYSPHNVKKINDVQVSNGELQQSAVMNSPNNVYLNKFDKLWTAFNLH